MKSNEYIKRRVVWKIRKSSMDIETWTNTSLWDDGKTEIKSELLKQCQFENGELPILYSFIDESNWTIFTTNSVYYSDKTLHDKINIQDIKDYKCGNFKGHGNQQTEEMVIETKAGLIHKCPYETGKMSMGSVYAIRTLVNLIQS